MNRTLGFLLVGGILFGSLPTVHAAEKAGEGTRVPASQPTAIEKAPAGGGAPNTPAFTPAPDGPLDETAGDWSQYLGGANRRARSVTPLPLPLKLAWEYRAGQAPSPAFNRTREGGYNLTVTSTYDLAFTPVVADGRVYYGSSSEEAVFCLEAASGRVLWTFYAEGAVRLAPTLHQGRVYFGSDDGGVYCVNGKSGDLLWKFNAARGERRIIANGRLASQWPVRTGIAIAEGTAYFAAGLFPAAAGVGLYAVDAETGQLRWQRTIDYAAQGYILATREHLFIPTGRAAPIQVRRADGQPMFPVAPFRRDMGGSFVGWVDDMIAYGPSEYGLLRIRATLEEPGKENVLVNSANARIAGSITGLSARRVVSDGKHLFFLRDGELIAADGPEFTAALQRSAREAISRSAGQFLYKSLVQMRDDQKLLSDLEKCRQWRVENTADLVALILAGDSLVAGGKNQVMALDPATGQVRWSAPVEGTAYDLAAAGGALYVSTDRGRLYCFNGPRPQATAVITPTSSPAPFPDDAEQQRCAKIAQAVRKAAPARKGYCLVLNAAEGQLAYELAKGSEWFVVAVETDPAKAKTARDNLVRTGLYGQRVVVHAGTTPTLPYPNWFANVVVCDHPSKDRPEPYSPAEVVRVLHPWGGMLVYAGKPQPDPSRRPADNEITWKTIEAEPGVSLAVGLRGALSGAGEWTHLYANPANTTGSGDQLIGTRYALQWFGYPGPEREPDRHDSSMAPLFKNGRLFVFGQDHLTGLDAYNGTVLWEKDVAGMTRLGIGYESGSACVDESSLYVAAKNTCWVLDPNTGEKMRELVGPRESEDWGYLAIDQGMLLGSNQDPRASWQSGGYVANNVRSTWNGGKGGRLVISHNLFATTAKSGERRWTYEGGAILNAAIAVGGGKVYFAECRRKDLGVDGTGRVALPDFVQADAWWVGLDLQTGAKAWEAPLRSKAEEILYLSYADKTLLATESHYAETVRTDPAEAKLAKVKPGEKGRLLHYGFTVLQAGDGKVRWAKELPATAVELAHNHAVQHPTLVAGKIFLPAYQTSVLFTLDLATGEDQSNRNFGSRKGCSLMPASADSLFYRKFATAGYDIRSRREFVVSDVTRPGCWLSTVPAGGLMLLPEATAGCNCGFPLQTTVVLAPAEAGP